MSNATKPPSFFSRRIIMGATVGGAILFFLLGIIFWGGFNTAMEATNKLEFCISCHEMEENVYQEYKPSIHYSNRTGVRATCPDCHVPKPWIHKVIRKIRASNEVFHKIMGTVSTPEKFDEHRLTMAKRVWKEMKNTDSRECRNCHNFESMNPKFQKKRARKQHLNAFETGQTCIDCHKGIAHTDVRDLLTDKEIEELEAPNPEFKREIPDIYIAGLKEAEAKEAKEKADKKAKSKKDKAAAKERVDKAVAAALANTASQPAAAQSTDAAPAAAPTTDEKAPAAASGSGMNWDDVPAREVNIFYPGQASLEWAMNGREHGGARAFAKMGDRCFDCHDEDAVDVGEKIVSGEILEPNVIPDKRGSIPVQVQAAHDGENLYMRFQWPDTGHTPAPFVDGGKMDPDNPIKLALMLATDDVEYAEQAGCWGTCHHDLKSMPDEADGEATKYITESRTEIEIKGKDGKKRGGWDKRKDDAAITEALDGGHFMDMLRFSAGTGKSEDGHVLADRVMEGGQGAEFTGHLDNGTWTVEMRRKLQSDKPGDIPLALDQVYNLGFAIHDDFTVARYHHVSLGYKLGFDDEEAEINAVKREASAPAAANTAAPAANATAEASAAATTAESVPAATGADTSGVDWSKASSREVNVFYPGQASLEWAMNGREHGGARAFAKMGDRCFDCHEEDAVDVGEKIVSGEILEPHAIPDKRGSIPVQVQATHDKENLYLKFEWPNTDHTPAPFVDGGKMDPDNPVKLALMLATDDVELADQSGCWGTCHHDLKSMPDEADSEATKYITESRTEIEIKGKDGKKRGGWDKRKDDAAITAELDGGHFMDMLRFKSGTGETENGHVLADRIMEGGQGAEFTGQLEGDTWTVVLKRKITSDKPGDLKLELDQVYNLGFAIHDDFSSARYHHVSLGYKLGFDDEEAEINAVSQ